MLNFSAPSCQPLCGEGSWRKSRSTNQNQGKVLVIWQVEYEWRPATISRFRYGDSFDMGFWTPGLRDLESRDPNWQYHSRPAIWTQDGNGLKAITLAGVVEWNMLDLDNLSQRSLQELPDAEGTFTKWENILLSADNDFLYAVPSDRGWV